MNFNKLIFSILRLMTLLYIASCTPEMDMELLSVRKQLVVDGSIENGRYAAVLLTYNTNYFSDLDSAAFRALVASRAKVTISDGTRSEILTLLRDTSYFPSLVYRSLTIKGEVGKTYTLFVEDEVDTVFASTTIPKPITLDSIWFESYKPGDSAGVVKGIFHDNKDEDNYYKTFTRVTNKSKKFYATLVSNFEDMLFNGEKFTFSLKKGPESYLNIVSDLNFKRGDIIDVKVTAIDKASYAFWRSYEDEVISVGNPFAANFHKLESNIKNGLGVWCGYGATYYRVIAQ